MERIVPPICHTCGSTLVYCQCLKKYQFTRSVAPFYYVGRARQGIIRLKFGGKTDAVPELAKEMTDTILKEYGEKPADYIVCVPMTKAKTKIRGFNQSELLAGAISMAIGVPFMAGGLIKVRETDPQKNCGERDRWSNVMGSFDVNTGLDIKNKNILLIDDVFTTGASLNECARMLKMAGASQVNCAVCAMTRKMRVVKPIKANYNVR